MQDQRSSFPLGMSIPSRRMLRATLPLSGASMDEQEMHLSRPRTIKCAASRTSPRLLISWWIYLTTNKYIPSSLYKEKLKDGKTLLCSISSPFQVDPNHFVTIIDHGLKTFEAIWLSFPSLKLRYWHVFVGLLSESVPKILHLIEHICEFVNRELAKQQLFREIVCSVLVQKLHVGSTICHEAPYHVISTHQHDLWGSCFCKLVSWDVQIVFSIVLCALFIMALHLQPVVLCMIISVTLRLPSSHDLV